MATLRIGRKRRACYCPDCAFFSPKNTLKIPLMIPTCNSTRGSVERGVFLEPSWPHAPAWLGERGGWRAPRGAAAHPSHCPQEPVAAKSRHFTGAELQPVGTVCWERQRGARTTSRSHVSSVANCSALIDFITSNWASIRATRAHRLAGLRTDSYFNPLLNIAFD